MEKLPIYKQMLNELKIQTGYDEATASGNLGSLYIIVHKGKVYLLNFEEENFVQKAADLARQLGLLSDGRSRILGFDDATDVFDNLLHAQLPGVIVATIDDTGFSGHEILLDVKTGSHFDPRQSTELPKLLRMFPGIEKMRIGRTIYDTKEFVSDFVERRVAENKMPKKVYHGTIYEYVNGILRKGIKATPENSHWTKIKHTDVVFLTSSFETAANYAKTASVKKGTYTKSSNREVIVEIDATKLDQGKILVDYDFYAELIGSGIPEYDKFTGGAITSGYGSYFVYTDKSKLKVDTAGHKGSLYNKFGYRGVIMPSWISAIYINDGDGYQKYNPSEVGEIKESTKMKHIKILESFSDNAKYTRIIPRDLFNEAKLLKCMGRLILKIHEKKTPCEMRFEHDGSQFQIVLNDAGDLQVANVIVYIKGTSYSFHTTYNSKSNYPLFVWDHDDMAETEVFDENGEFTQEFVEFCKNK